MPQIVTSDIAQAVLLRSHCLTPFLLRGPASSLQQPSLRSLAAVCGRARNAKTNTTSSQTPSSAAHTLASQTASSAQPPPPPQKHSSVFCPYSLGKSVCACPASKSPTAHGHQKITRENEETRLWKSGKQRKSKTWADKSFFEKFTKNALIN